MKARRKLCHFLLTLVWVVGIISLNSSRAKAASNFQVINVTNTTETVGGVTFSSKYSSTEARWYVYYEKEGKKNLLTDEGGVSTIIMTDGKLVYYFVANRFEKSFYDYYEIDTVYEKNMSTHATKEVFSIKTKDGIHFAGYYSGKIFYVKNIDPGTLCFYNLKTGNNRTLLRNVTNANQYGRVFLCNPYAGGGPPFKFFTYNAKSNKSRTLTKQLMCYRVIKKRIYFVEYVRSYDNSDYISYDDYIGNVIRCDLNGKHKKILLKNQRIQGVVDKITSSYLTYKNSALDRSYKIYY